MNTTSRHINHALQALKEGRIESCRYRLAAALISLEEPPEQRDWSNFPAVMRDKFREEEEGSDA